MLPNLSDVAVSAAAEESYRAHLPLLIGRMPGAQIHRTKRVEWSASGLPIPGLNAVTRFNAPRDAADEAIDKIVSTFRGRHTPFVVWVGSATAPMDLGERLRERGLTKFDRPGMAVDLRAIPSVESPPDTKIARVVDQRGVADWVDAAVRAQALAEETRSAYTASFNSTALGENAQFILYLGRLNGVPVATSWLFPDGAVAGLYGVSTVPEVRRQGFGTAMSVAALAEGMGMGYRVAVLFSSDMAVGVYRALGFSPVCILEGYRWYPE